MAQLDKPNLVLSLAASYDTRGFDGYTNVVTNAQDQRKINSMYQPIVNAITGRATLRLAKRPGLKDSGNTVGSAGEIQYLIETLSAAGGTPWVITKNGNTTRACDLAAGANTILNNSAYFPVFVDKTLISGTETVVVQLRHTNGDLSTVQKIYFASAIGTWTEITDADFTALFPMGKAEHLDGFMLVLTSTNKVQNSDLNSLANWTATSSIAKQIQQDRPMGLMRLGRIILACGATTMEGFYNAGNISGSPLGRIPQLSQRIGLAPCAQVGGLNCRHYYTTLGKRLYFAGSQEGVNASLAQGIYSFDGSSVEKVSTLAIDSILGEVGPTHICSIAVAGRFAIAVALSAATTATQRWLMYFPDWKEWFEWDSGYCQPANNGVWFLGIGTGTPATKVGYMGDLTNYLDGTATAYTMTHQFKLPSKGNHRKFMPVCGVIGDTQTSASNLTVEFSDDDYQSFSTGRTIDLTSQKKQLYRCGSYRDRAVRLTHSANTDCRLEAFVATVK